MSDGKDKVRKVYIYALSDPRTNFIRYVGKTLFVNKRYAQHLRVKKPNSHKSSWIIHLRTLNLSPVMEILEECDETNWVECEKFWIETLRFYGFDLTNLTRGGDGCGMKPSQETLNKLRSSHLGFKQSPEQRKKISESLSKFYATHPNHLKGVKRREPGEFKHSNDTILKISRAKKGVPLLKLRGRKLSKEHCEKLSKSHMNQTFSKEWREKVSSAVTAWWARRKEAQNV